MTESFDLAWRMESVRIAAMEQLEVEGKLTMDTLFIRAKDIFNAGYENRLHEWETYWIDKKGPKPEVEPTLRPKVELNVIKCPGCGEDVLSTWKKHAYKKDGTKCGYVFS